MKRTGLLLLSAVTAFGCQQANSDKTGKQLEEINSKLDKLATAIEKMPAAKAGAARPQRPQRPRPQPKSVYAVNIDGSPFKGAKDAKVTVVEAFEFA